MSQIQERQTRIIELHQRSRMWHIIYENLADYNERTKTSISIYFHFASQSDAQANLDIAKFMKVSGIYKLFDNEIDVDQSPQNCNGDIANPARHLCCCMFHNADYVPYCNH